ncbi:ABC transporter permease [Companilactobacillus nodensis]|uniref:ABC-type Na+ efflux pump, permease n=1 Tax=Companilactobacillus nodensis DSM 19682 = JCM 14932 = NBRC 107160 TaxID=1423775 RepID=A0A0R1K5R8_9LACO|nr:ABC transporter permease [Companilactobacillus nodensis]KRK78958.1 ABC-type Na+ efflux pump, permease [Companilactobacillus nodensis DSM 19682 = JCM 14932 = NBRC 107160]
MNKLWIVTFETFLRQVKSWGFVVLILGPFLIFGISIGAGYMSASSASSSDKIAVFGQSELKQAFVKQNKDDVDTEVQSEKSAEKKIKHNNLAGYLVLKTSDNQVVATYHGSDSMSNSLKSKLTIFTTTVQQQLNYATAQLSPTQARSLQQQPKFKEVVTKKTGTDNLAKLISFWIMVILVYTILITYTSITAQEIASEKGTKIMEVIFSSTTATKYFIGKVLGVMLVIVTQILIYVVGGWGMFSFAQHSELTKDAIAQNKDLIGSVLHNLLSINLVYLLLGVVIYTILAALCGALVAKSEDAAKAAQPVTMLSMLAFFITLPFQNNMDALVVKILSYVPFFSSYFMPMRVINGEATPVEMTISLVILIVTIIFMAYYIGKIYQGLMLQTDDSSFWKRLKRGIAYNK